MLKEVKDCKVIPGGSVVTQHRIIIIDMNWEKCKREMLSSKKDSKIRWWTLNNEQAKVFVEKINGRVNQCIDGKINNVQEKNTETIKIITEEVLGRNRGRIVDKDTWWWNK